MIEPSGYYSKCTEAGHFAGLSAREPEKSRLSTGHPFALNLRPWASPNAWSTTDSTGGTSSAAPFHWWLARTSG
jgi:hypothetical protein